MEMFFGAAAFILLFTAWVIVPTIVKKRHTIKIDENEDA